MAFVAAVAAFVAVALWPRGFDASQSASISAISSVSQSLFANSAILLHGRIPLSYAALAALQKKFLLQYPCECTD